MKGMLGNRVKCTRKANDDTPIKKRISAFMDNLSKKEEEVI